VPASSRSTSDGRAATERQSHRTSAPGPQTLARIRDAGGPASRDRSRPPRHRGPRPRPAAIDWRQQPLDRSQCRRTTVAAIVPDHVGDHAGDTRTKCGAVRYEPFASLDAITRHQVTEDLLRWVDREEITVLLVTHDLEEAITLSDRVHLLPRGLRLRALTGAAATRPRPRTTRPLRTSGSLAWTVVTWYVKPAAIAPHWRAVAAKLIRLCPRGQAHSPRPRSGRVRTWTHGWRRSVRAGLHPARQAGQRPRCYHGRRA